METNEQKRLEQIIETLAVNYATDSDGVFSLPDYIAFKDGVRAGMAANMMLEHNARVVPNGSNTN